MDARLSGARMREGRSKAMSEQRKYNSISEMPKARRVATRMIFGLLAGLAFVLVVMVIALVL